MGFRFFRRIKLAPGLSLNLSKRGGSLSLGPRGAKVSLGTGGVRRTVGLPGTGMYYTQKLNTGSKSHGGRSRHHRTSRPASDGQAPPPPAVGPEDRLDLGFFRRLVTPQDEEGFVDAMRQVVLEHDRKAYDHAAKATHLADAAFLAGVLALKFKRFEEAGQHLRRARQKHAGLGKYFGKYDIDAAMSLPITDRISVHVGPSMRGVLLALAEAHQGLGAWREAARALHSLHQKNPQDPVVLLSLAELLVEDVGGAKAYQRVVKLTKDVENQGELQAAILLWKGKALRLLGLHTAARDTLTAAFRRKKGRDEELLQAIEYERALVYEQLGKKSRARKEWEKLYAQAPEYEDVAQRLGLAAS